MKTLRKTLSLTLVFALVFSLMSFAFAADTTTTTKAPKLSDFTDADKLTYTEAADYLIAAGIVKGDTATTLNPKGDFTRAQAAKLVAYAALGQTAADNLKVSADPFKDVPAGNWAAGYIAYCQKQGFVNGYGDGNFGPNDKVTGYQMAKMLLCSLGYGVNGEFTGSGWELAVAPLALSYGIFNDNPAGASAAAATREEAFLYTFNTLGRLCNVSYNKNLAVYYVPGREAIATNPASVKADRSDTLGYQRFKMAWVSSDGTYSEPAHYWTINGKSVTDTYSNAPITKLASSADGTPYANLTAKSDPKYIRYSADDVCTYYINGDQQKTTSEIAAVKDAAGIRGNQVSFYDTDKNGKYDTVEVLVYKVVKLTSAPVIHTSGANDVVTIADMGMKNVVAGNITGDYKNLAKDDYVLYFSNEKKTSWTISKCETVTGQMFGFNASVYQVNVNGTTVNASQIAMNGASNPTAAFAQAWNDIIETKGLAGTVFYYDIGKNICAAEPTQNVVAAANVVFVLDTEPQLGGGVRAQLLKSDGTAVIKPIDKIIGTDNSSAAATSGTLTKFNFYTFTENKDGSYNLKEIHAVNAAGSAGKATQAKKTDYAAVDATPVAVFTKGAASYANGIASIGTNKTVFVIEGEGSKANTYKAYTGVATIPNVQDTNAAAITAKAYVLNDKDGYAIMAVALKAHSDTTTAKLDYAFIGSDASHVSMTGNASDDFYQYDYAVINGEIKKFSSVNTLNMAPGVYAINGYDGDKIDSVIINPAEFALTRAYTTSNLLAKAGNLATGFDVVGNTVTVKGDAATSFVVTDDVKVFVLDGYDKKSGVVTLDKAGSIGAIENLRGDYYTVLSLRVSDKDNTINELFIGIQPKGTVVTPPEADTNVVLQNAAKASIVDALLAGTSNVDYYVEAAADAGIVAKRTAVNNALTAAGATGITWANDGKVTFTVDKISYTSTTAVTFTRVYKLTVGTTVSYVAPGATNIAKGTDKGTGFIATANNATTYAAYGSYTMTAYDTVIAKGYVKAKISDMAGGSAATYAESWKHGTTAVNAASGEFAVKVGDTLVNTITLGDTGITATNSDDKFTLTCANGTVTATVATAVGAYANKAVTLANGEQKNVSFTFTVTAGETDMTDLTVAYSAGT